MASPDASSSPTFPLLALPGEIQNAVVACFDFPELYKLRLTNRYFYASIPRIPRERLLKIQKEFMDHRFYACLECERLRPRAEFSHGMLFPKGPSSKSAQRCRECVCRKAYEPGSRWEEYLVPFVWCLTCNKIAEAPVDTRVTNCVSCHREEKRPQRMRRKREIEAARHIKSTEARKSREIEAAGRNKLNQDRNSRRMRRSRTAEAAIV